MWRAKIEHPIFLLNSGCSAPVYDLCAKPSSKGRFYIFACTKKSAFFFKLKNPAESASKTVSASSELKLAPGIDQIYTAALESNTSATLVYGSMFNLLKSKIELTEGEIEVEMPSEQ